MAKVEYRRLYHKTYLQMIRNSVGSQQYRNFYVESLGGKEFDGLDNGKNSCAFFVSSVLTLFKKVDGVHGTVEATEKDLVRSGWQKVSEGEILPGDVIIWAAMEFKGETHEHIGFSIDKKTAISTSWTKLKVIRHSLHFDNGRAIKAVYRMASW